MSNEEFNLKKIRSNKLNWLPFLIALFSILFLVLIIKSCNPPNKFWNGNKPNNSFSEGRIIYPDKPNVLIPIDTTKIIFPKDSLKRPILSNLLNVYLKDTTNLKDFSKKVISHYKYDSITVKYWADEYKRVQFSVREDRRENLKNEIRSDFSEVKFVCYESILTTSKEPGSDPGFKNSDYDWFYKQIGLYEAWKVTMGSPSIKIAVIDDSFDPLHPELKDQIESPWNVFEYSNNINSKNGKSIHGTHVAGTIAGEINNGYGISGVAPNCKIIPIQIADSNGRMTTSSILDGIFYALKNDADVINMSLGINMTSQIGNLPIKDQEEYAKKIYVEEAEMWNEVYEIAKKEGVVIVQAAGNSSVIAALDPMKRSEISIVVGATNRSKEMAKFSNFGKNVDVFAPGVNIYSSVPNKKFELLNGTSMASPIVAGCVALMKSQNKNLSVLEIKKLLNEYGDEIDENGRFIQIHKIILNIN